MYITICKIDDQGKFDAWSRALKAGALGQPRGMGWGGGREGHSGWGDTYAAMADSCRCMAKNPPQYCKVINHRLKKKKESAYQCRRHGFDLWVGNIPRRRKWQSTPVFLPRNSQGQRSLVGYGPWVLKESDKTEATYTQKLRHITSNFLLQ